LELVFLLQHLHLHPNGEEDVSCIGIYRTREAAEAAVARLKSQPGFRDNPGIVEDGSGFYIDRYKLDQDNWSEGFDIVCP
jgi:homoserine kinase type II